MTGGCIARLLCRRMETFCLTRARLLLRPKGGRHFPCAKTLSTTSVPAVCARAACSANQAAAASPDASKAERALTGLRQNRGGRLPRAMKTSWLTQNPISQGKALSMKP